MPAKIDISGQRFGRLIALKRLEPKLYGNKKRYFWLCKCDCGNEIEVESGSLTSGNTKSCGCLADEVRKQPKPKQNLLGMRFGRLVVIEDEGMQCKYDKKEHWYKCRCDCGTVKSIRGRALCDGGTQSCGCQKLEILGGREFHGLSKTRLFGIWSSMIDRCRHNDNYAGRGIKVCKEWEDSFLSFRDWAYANGYDENAPFGECTLDRIDNDGDYEPNNCRWVNFTAQENNKRTNRYITVDGETHTMAEWSRINNIPIARIKSRLHKGWDEAKAVTLPKMNRWGIVNDSNSM